MIVDDDDGRPGTARGMRPSDNSDVTTHRRLAGRIYEAALPKAVFPAITADGEIFGLLTEGAKYAATASAAWTGRCGEAANRRDKWAAVVACSVGVRRRQRNGGGSGGNPSARCRALEANAQAGIAIVGRAARRARQSASVRAEDGAATERLFLR